jgi:triphosphoribosyl-dephospho-CoA synthase
VIDVSAAFVAACEAELTALKPGNVHDLAGGHGMIAEDFRQSAAAAAPHIADARLGIGERVLAAVRATRDAVGQNTNLGILLLCAPLARAAERSGTLAENLQEELTGLSVGDASAAFAAIRLASPGGLGDAAEADVRTEPTIDLHQAMALAADHDRIAWNYVHGFQDVFRRGLPRLRALRGEGWPESWVVTGLFMALLKAVPDSHVARKFGRARALDLRARARPLAKALLTAAHPALERDRLLAFDTELKNAGINPGTTADLSVACLFADRLSHLRVR